MTSYVSLEQKSSVLETLPFLHHHGHFIIPELTRPFAQDDFLLSSRARWYKCKCCTCNQIKCTELSV